MTGTRGTWNEATEIRAIRIVSAHSQNIRPSGRVRFRVLSERSGRWHEVVVDAEGWSCDCEAWLDRRTPCAHIVATVRWLDPNPVPFGPQSELPKKRRYRQVDDAAWDEAQQLEHQQFDRLVWDLLGNVPEVVSPVGKRGRPAISLRTKLLMAIRKVHLGQSMRRSRGLLVVINQDGKGILPRVPNYAVPSRLFTKDYATELLLGLVERSGLILRDLEDKGTVAIDSSGFCTTCMGAYCTEKHDPSRRHSWVKAHIAVGVKTHIVLSAKITDEHGADYTQFGPLLTRVVAAGHKPKYATGDLAYSGRSNHDVAESLGVDPVIPFKSNARGLAKGSPIWNRKFHEFMARRDEFDAIYHQRSNVEATFSSIKRKLGEPLLSREPIARINETLAKLVAYNVGIVIQQSLIHKLRPAFIGDGLNSESATDETATGAA